MKLVKTTVVCSVCATEFEIQVVDDNIYHPPICDKCVDRFIEKAIRQAGVLLDKHIGDALLG